MMTMHWRERANHDNRGTGIDMEDDAEAKRICSEANVLFPRFTHWATPIEKDEQDG